MKGTKTERLKTVLGVIGLASIVYFAVLGIVGERTASAQVDTYLSRRVDQLEQRFYMIESRLSRAEQDARIHLQALAAQEAAHGRLEHVAARGFPAQFLAPLILAVARTIIADRVKLPRSEHRGHISKLLGLTATLGLEAPVRMYL